MRLLHIVVFVCLLFVCLFALFFTSHQQIFRNVGTGRPGLKQYLARINVTCSRTHCNAAGESRTCRPSVSNQALYR